jgi:hypothetical protein
MDELKYEIVSKVINELISKDAFIDSCEQVLKKVQASDERSKILVQRSRNSKFLVTITDVNKIMRKMGLRYRKVTHIANSANSPTSKILR